MSDEAMPALPEAITIRDCGPRDGLQGEEPLAPASRAALANALFDAGLADVEVASFVSPRAVPAMAGAAEVVAAIPARRGARRWALVPNRKGAELALAAGIDHLTVTVSASPAYSEKNVGMTVEQSLEQVVEIRKAAEAATIDAVVSCAFGSPFPERVGPDAVAAVVEEVREAGVDAVTLADTTGVATPRRLRVVLGATGSGVGLHLHDTRGTALANAYAALAMGVTRFDTALGGLGGSPFAPAAGGNLATEDLVLLAGDLGISTGVDLSRLLDAGRMLTDLVGHPLPSRVAAAGPLPDFPVAS